jgi:hypothetical protein
MKGLDRSRHWARQGDEIAMTKRPGASHRTSFALSAALAVVCACDATHVLGTADGGQSQSPGTGGTSPGAGGTAGAGPGTVGAAGATIDPTTLGPSESWTGYVENRTFASGSDALTLTFATDAKGVVAGTIVFGKGTPPPPATDPNVGYPADLVSSSSFGPGPGLAMGYVAEGYSYVFDGGSLDTHRLRFTANLSQLWAGWCALQTPASDGSGGCLPNWGSMSSGDGKCAQLNPQTQKYVPVDCGKLFLCSPIGVCSCTASKCGVSANSSNATFDIFLTGDTASGSAEMPFFGMTNVHFVKN